MTLQLGTVRPGSTIYIPFATYDKDDGSSITMTGLAATDIEVYKDGSVTQRSSDNGYTLLDTDGIDFDSITGAHGFSISLADNTDAGFWAAGSRYFVWVSSITVDAVTVTFLAAVFDIGYPDAVLNTTIATLASQTSFTLTVGPAEDDALNGCVVRIHDVASAVQAGFAVVLDYTGSTKTVTLAAGTTFTAAATDNIAFYPPANVNYWLGTPAATPTVAGVPEVDVTHWIGTAAATPTVAGVPEVDITHVGGATTDVSALATNVAAILVDTATIDTAGEIAAAVWSADATTYQTQGTFGQAIGDPVADTGSIFKAVVTDATAATVGLDVVAALAAIDAVDNFVDTEVGALTTELAKVPKSDGTATWNATALASLQSEATDALNAYDPPTKAEMDSGLDALPTATENADALLNRDMSAVSDTTARSPLNALRAIRNKTVISGGTLTVYEEDDTTSAWTSAITTTAGNPISASDPT